LPIISTTFPRFIEHLDFSAPVTDLLTRVVAGSGSLCDQMKS
jgi:hypothetical protein